MLFHKLQEEEERIQQILLKLPTFTAPATTTRARAKFQMDDTKLFIELVKKIVKIHLINHLSTNPS